jgi:hypothetical protein
MHAQIYIVRSVLYDMLELWLQKQQQQQKIHHFRTMYSFYFLAPTCYGIVTILRELGARFN